MINLKISGPSGFRRMMPSAAEIWTGIDEASDDVDRRCWIEWGLSPDLSLSSKTFAMTVHEFPSYTTSVSQGQDIDGRCHGIKHLMFGGISGFILFHFATHHFFLIESGNQDMLDALFVCKSLVAAKLEIKACGMKCSFKVGHISERNYAGSVISFGELLMWKIDQILLEMECKFGEKEEKQKEKGRGGDIGPPNPNHVRLFVVFRKICKLKKAERSALWG
ncbi:hypothetical protein V6N13_052521 [Hibiscus sabdariffa]